MCLAIYKPVGLDIPEKNLKNGFESNNDGCGICWSQDGVLHVEKGMMTWDAFIGIYNSVKEFPMLIHFRKASHGKKNSENCHPFLFNDGKLALIHNGVIPIKCSEDGFSDTWHFVNKVLEPIIKNRNVPIDDSSLSWFIRVSIGTDKIVVMDQNGEAIIFNEEKGNWEETDGFEKGKKGKVWYSNYSFRYSSSSNYKSPSSSPGICGYNGGNLSNNYSPSNRSVEPEDDENAREWPGYNYHSSGKNDQFASAEIATDENRGPGKLCEYGWFDAEIEKEIEDTKSKLSLGREDSIVQIFNNA